MFGALLQVADDLGGDRFDLGGLGANRFDLGGFGAKRDFFVVRGTPRSDGEVLQTFGLL